MESGESKRVGTPEEWERFARLGEMIGDGLHYEPDGKWITREYRSLMHYLIPETKKADKEQRAARRKQVNDRLKELLKDFKCHNCNQVGTVTQNRSGARRCKCYCGQNFTLKKPKKV